MKYEDFLKLQQTAKEHDLSLDNKKHFELAQKLNTPNTIQVPVARPVTAPVDDEENVAFSDFSTKKITATAVNADNIFPFAEGDNVKIIKGISLGIRFSPENKDDNKISIIFSDKNKLLAAGINDRSFVPSMFLRNVTCSDMVRANLAKVGNALKTDGKKPTEKHDVAVGAIAFKWKNCGPKDQPKYAWTVLGISIEKLIPESVIEVVAAKSVKPVATTLSTPSIVPATQLVLGTFSDTISKDDPWLLNDSMLKGLGYRPNINITSKNQEDLRNRIAEYVYSKQFQNLEWLNEKSEQYLHYDYRVRSSSLTIDIKTIAATKFNLPIDVTNVEANKMADAYSLALVEDMGLSWRILCYGFISKQSVLDYIKAIPRSLMPDHTWYKIDKKIFQRLPLSL